MATFMAKFYFYMIIELKMCGDAQRWGWLASMFYNDEVLGAFL